MLAAWCAYGYVCEKLLHDCSNHSRLLHTQVFRERCDAVTPFQIVCKGPVTLVSPHLQTVSSFCTAAHAHNNGSDLAPGPSGEYMLNQAALLLALSARGEFSGDDVPPDKTAGIGTGVQSALIVQGQTERTSHMPCVSLVVASSSFTSM